MVWLLLGTFVLGTLAVGTLAVAQNETIGAFIYLGGDTQFVYTNDYMDEGASLNFTCLNSGELVLVYELAGYMGGDREDRVRVSYDVDDRGFVDSMMWNLLDSQRSAYMPRGQMAAFLQLALTGQEVYFGVTDPLDSEVRVHGFSLNGFRNALSRLSCYP